MLYGGTVQLSFPSPPQREAQSHRHRPRKVEDRYVVPKTRVASGVLIWVILAPRDVSKLGEDLRVMGAEEVVDPLHLGVIDG